MRKRAPLPGKMPPQDLLDEAEASLRQYGFHEGMPNFRVWVLCHARVLWRHRLGL